VTRTRRRSSLRAARSSLAAARVVECFGQGTLAACAHPRSFPDRLWWALTSGVRVANSTLGL